MGKVRGQRNGVDVEIDEAELARPKDAGIPPLPQRITKEDLVDRMTNEELVTFLEHKKTWTLRQQEKLHSLTHVEKGTPAWTLLATKLEAAFGRARATEIMKDVVVTDPWHPGP